MLSALNGSSEMTYLTEELAIVLYKSERPHIRQIQAML